ncbi:MAG: helix-turn-helix transcriptional regulator [Myxococcales bacterium]|nr:helix-turn-helix transcriptional regulator [Myxococcales bacterium]MCB1174211.1 helix-turn-helix transcriptional regulator [Leptospiraceae bacterium]
MSPEDIKELRKELNCTARELAETLGLEQKEILAWEDGELFPTKRWVSAMERLRKQGPTAIKKKPRGKSKALTGVARMNDPELWSIVRKLLTHPQLFDQVKALAKDYAEPT